MQIDTFDDVEIYQRAFDELNGLLSDLSEKKADEFDRVINERTPFRREPIQL